MDKLLVYKTKEDDLLLKIQNCIAEKSESACVEMLTDLVDFSVRHGFYGDLFKCYLAYFLVNNENVYTYACEKTGEPGESLLAIAKNDFEIIRQLYLTDYSSLINEAGFSSGDFVDFKEDESTGHIFNKDIRDAIIALVKKLDDTDTTLQFQKKVNDFYRDYGVGKIGLHKAFRLDENGDIVSISKVSKVSLDDLVGYDIQKKKLVDNTESFVMNRPANNCLLYGDAGTGKSTSIKAIMNQYYGDGLRIIEIYKSQFQFIPKVIGEIKNRNYKFILYMDDLSFEEFETEYKFLKAAIEGGLEKKPKNVLIYATSNRRHLIRESFADKKEAGDIHRNDTVQEKLSLSGRFGVSIYYPSPNKKEFNNIVLELKKHQGVKMDDEAIILEANKWELSHGGLSGRTAQQFIDYLLGQQVD